MSKPKFSTGHVHNVWEALHTVRREREWSVVWTVLAQRNISQPSLLENSILTKLLNVLNVRLCRRGFQVVSSISSVTLDKRAHLNYHCEKMSEILNGSYFSATHQLNELLLWGGVKPLEIAGNHSQTSILLLYFSDFHVMDIQTKCLPSKKGLSLSKKEMFVKKMLIIITSNANMIYGL